MQLEQLELTGGGTLTVYLRESVEAMPHWWCPAAAIPTSAPGRATP